MNLDIKTIVICIFISNLFSAILMMAYNAQHRDKTINVFISGKWLQVCGYLLVGTTNFINEYISMMGGNILLLAGAGTETIAMMMLIDRWNSKYEKIYTFAITSSILIYAISFIAKVTPSIRIMEVSLSVCLFIIYPIIHLTKKHGHSQLRIITAGIYLITICAHIARFFDVLTYSAPLTMFTPTPIQTLSFLCLLITSVGGSCGFILLAKEKADDELIRVATHDGLTGTLNRTTFISQAEKGLSIMKHQNKNGAFMIIDIDLFKIINDTYGHTTGDSVLISFSNIIMQQLSKNALFGRYGGEQFAIFLQNVDEAQSLEIAERLRKIIENNCGQVNYTISIGLSTSNPESTIDILIMEADLALYEAKRGGRNRVVKFGTPKRSNEFLPLQPEQNFS